ncbi:MFS transporter [Nocardioides acrostichi]|uniref:MHS family MFS transporter n=1 Tax=Nocardioides acrostichi TaxID=2784339 RepID=A0A930V3L1_9ACTN|nr:MFS transporter [Nocardioides acrostichi]MBF4163095.1 MHS family MFS transporter [Nocardioides acrostichi]
MTQTDHTARPATAGAAADPREYRRVLASSFLGSTVEFYDFLLYGTAASLVFGQLFFSELSDSAALTASFATFAVGYVARPLGGFLFGHLGDRVGRKATLMTTMTIMGLSSTLIGFLPTHDQIGTAAPLLLLGLRVLQGVAVGGEWGGAALMALEHAPERERGLAASVANMGGPAGAMLATLAFALMTTLPEDQLLSWGWRVPFLLSAALVGVSLYVRVRISESPLFVESMKRAESADRRKRLPAAVILTRYRSQLFVGTLGALAAVVYSIFMATFALAAAEASGVAASHVLVAKAAAAFVHIFAIAFFARLSDRVGRRPVILTGCALSIVLVYPLLALLGSGNGWLVLIGFLVGSPLIQGCLYGPTAAFIAERFSTEARYTGAGVSYQLATLLAGFVPLIATPLWLAGQHGHGEHSVWQFGYVGAFLIGCAAVTAVVVGFSRETRSHALT